MFVAMAVGMRFIKKGFIDEADLYAGYIDKLGKVSDDRTKISAEHSVEKIESDMEGIAQRELTLFDGRKIDIKSDLIFGSIFYLFIAGGVLLLSSFLDFSKVF